MVKFNPRNDCSYKFDYPKIFADIASGKLEAIPTYRHLVLNDLFFLLYFVYMQGASQDFLDTYVNSPFVVNACREVESGPRSGTLDLWAREHFKSTIITQCEVIQRVLANPEERVAILSYTRPAAKALMRPIMTLLENSVLLKSCFPDVLYADPKREGAKWNEDEGLTVKRRGVYKECTVEAWGLIEGMPTGRHYTHRVYDDIVTEDMLDSADCEEMFRKILRKYDSSQNIGTFDGTFRILGTHYHHLDPLMELRKRTHPDGRPMYTVRLKPATDDGTPTGKPVLLTQERLDQLRGDPYIFACQQLLNPTPLSDIVLDSDRVKIISRSDVPRGLVKFMVVDQAGADPKHDKGDAWAIGLFGVSLNPDDMGASDVYLLDAVIEPMKEDDAIHTIVNMYLRGGFVSTIGVEKVGVSSTHLHIQSALQAQGRYISEQNKTLYLLNPRGRNKRKRIASALVWPLNNGKLHIADSVPEEYINRILMEMNKFPHWHDDALDMFAYAYDIILDEDFTFSTVGYSDNRKFRVIIGGLA